MTVKWSAFASGTTIAGSDVTVGLQGGVNVQWTWSQALTYVAGATATLTNKTYDTAGSGNSFSINGVSVTANTGTGAVARAAAPTFTTPTLGVATATTINKVTLTAPATGSTLTITDGKTLLVSNTLTFAGTDSSSVAFGAGGTVLYNGGALGTPASGTLTNCTGLPNAAVVGLGALALLATASLTANVSGILPTANGGTGIAFFTAAGPTAARIYTFPDASCSILTTNALVTGAQGGTGVANTGFTFTLAGTSAIPILTNPTSGSLQLGAADADTNAAIVAQVFRTQGLLAGGTADQAGKNLTIIVSPGKGTGAGGSFIVQTAPAGSTGTTVGTATTALTITSAQQLLAGAAQSWTVPTFAVNSTSGMSNFGGLNFIQASVSFLNMNAIGSEFANVMPTAGILGWAPTTDNTGGAGDTFIGRGGIAFVRVGKANAASPVSQTIGSQGSRSGTDSNVGGGNLTIQSGLGTGTGAVSTLSLNSPIKVGSGTGAQTSTAGLVISSGVAVTTNYTVANLPTATAGLTGALAFVTDGTLAFTSTLVGVAPIGGGSNKVPVYCDGSSWLAG